MVLRHQATLCATHAGARWWSGGGGTAARQHNSPLLACARQLQAFVYDDSIGHESESRASLALRRSYPLCIPLLGEHAFGDVDSFSQIGDLAAHTVDLLVQGSDSALKIAGRFVREFPLGSPGGQGHHPLA